MEYLRSYIDKNDTFWYHKNMKRGRDPVQTRRKILAAAFGEVFRRGFQGVSVDQIVAKTDVTKGAFYHHFATKEELGYALVDDVVKEMILDRWIRPLAAYKNPLQGIVREFKKRIDETPEEHVVLGCPLNNLVQEMAPVDAGFRDRLRAALNLWIDEIEKQLRRAQAGGFLKRDVDVRPLAEFVVMVHEGSFGVAKGLGEKRKMYSFHDSLRRHLESVGQV